MDHSSSSADGEQSPHVLRHIKPFYLLLNDLSKDVDYDYLQELCTLCLSRDIPDEEFKCKTPSELFRKLDECGEVGEDNTGFLKELLNTAQHIAGVEMVEEYEEDRRKHLENVELLLQEKDPLFVGRTAFVRKILEFLQDSHSTGCRCVLVYGLAGTGKTKLAVESCAIYKTQQKGSRLLRINLHKATRNNEVWLWTFNKLTAKQISYKQFEINLFKDWVMQCEQDTIVYLDNADAILNSSSHTKKEFIQTLSEVLSLKNSLVKILITSRHPVDVKGTTDIPHFVAIKLEHLTEDESTVLLTKMVTRASQKASPHLRRDDPALVEIARLCGWNPQALRAVASRLRSGFKPEDLAAHLKKFELVERVLEPGFMAASAAFQDIEGQQPVLKSLNAMYEELAPALQKALLNLTVFPTSFTLEQAATILDHKELAIAEFDLVDLTKWSLIENDQESIFELGRSYSGTYYYVHPLVRFVCLAKVQSTKADRNDYEGALRRFIELVNGVIKTLTKLGHRDFPQALAYYEVNMTNVLHFLEIDMGRKFDSNSTEGQQDSQGCLPLLSAREELYSMLQSFLDPDKRLEYYDMKKEQMLRENEVAGWAYLGGWVGDEQATKAQYSIALKTVGEPLERVKSGTTNDSERAKAKLLYVKGRICSESGRFQEAINTLEEALSIHQRLLGDHTLTARCLNALGHAYYNEAEESRVETGAKALEYHKKAWKMLAKITSNHPEKHFDAPRYLLNIGSSYHQAGKNICHEQKAKDFFRRAIKTYKEALELAESLKLKQQPSTAYMLKNIAMSHYEMGEYEVALPWAKEASKIREEKCWLHPATARNLYFVGTLHEKLGDQLKEAGQTLESGKNFVDGLEYFKKAIKVEFKLEKHSSEYDYLKKDTIELMEKLNMDKDIEKYRIKFVREDEKASCSTDEQTPTSYLEDGVEVSMHQHPQGEGAGGSETRKRKTPGPVMLEESQNKVCRCC